MGALAAAGGGAIVNTASVAGLVGLPSSSAYAASKHGVVGLTRTAAGDHAEENIRVNAVCPGYIETPMTEDTMRRRGDRVLARVPMARMGRPEEIARSLLPPDAAPELLARGGEMIATVLRERLRPYRQFGVL